MKQIPIPDDYRERAHKRPPQTRVEMLAWNNRNHAFDIVRAAAQTILVEAGIIPFSHHHTRGKIKIFARNKMAQKARALRILLQAIEISKWGKT